MFLPTLSANKEGLLQVIDLSFMYPVSNQNNDEELKKKRMLSGSNQRLLILEKMK
jgi:hypothetical protein